MMDGVTNPDPPGFVFAFNAANLSDSSYPLSFQTTSTSGSNGGGVWQGGAGLAAGVDSASGNTYVYFATGNGTFDAYRSSPPNTDYGEAFLKLTSNTLAASSYYAPADAIPLGCPCSDTDLGSGGTTLIPDGTLGTGYGYLAVQADKAGRIHVMDRGSPGGYTGACSTPVPSCPPPNGSGGCSGSLPSCSGTDANLENIATSSGYVFHNSPAYWNLSLYYGQAHTSPISLYQLSTGCSTPPVCPTSVVSNDGNGNEIKFQYGTTPTVSSNGTSGGSGSGVVWALWNDGQAKSADNPPAASQPLFYAFRSDNLNELYDSYKCVIGSSHVDQPGFPTKFSVPTVANGYVYVATQSDFNIYGPLSRSCN